MRHSYAEYLRMKRLFLPLVVLLLVGVALATGLMLSTKETQAANFLLVLEAGEVSFRSEGGEYERLDLEEVELVSGSYVKTGGDGLAHVVLQNNSVVSLDNNTELQVNISEEKTSVFQLIGSTWNRIENISGYEVQTSDIVAAVRGTVFAVDISPDGSDVTVIESEVEVSDYRVVDGVRQLLNSKRVPAGKFLKFRSQLLDVVDIPEEILRRRWYLQNISLDSELQQQRDVLKTLRADRLEQLDSITSEDTIEFLQNLRSRYDIASMGNMVCEYVNSSLVEDMRRLESLGVLEAAKREQIASYLNLLDVYCSDQQLVEAERDELLEVFLKLYQVDSGQIVSIPVSYMEILDNQVN